MNHSKILEVSIFFLAMQNVAIFRQISIRFRWDVLILTLVILLRFITSKKMSLMFGP